MVIGRYQQKVIQMSYSTLLTIILMYLQSFAVICGIEIHGRAMAHLMSRYQTDCGRYIGADTPIDPVFPTQLGQRDRR